MPYTACALPCDGYNGAPLLKGPVTRVKRVVKRPYKTKVWQNPKGRVRDRNKVVIYTISIDGEDYFGIIRHLG